MADVDTSVSRQGAQRLFALDPGDVRVLLGRCQPCVECEEGKASQKVVTAAAAITPMERERHTP